MLTLGLAGGLDPVYGDLYDSPQNFTYDGAAVLLEDDVLVAAIEEERLNRIRHSNKFPFQSIAACLERRGVRLSDVDRIAYYAAEDASNDCRAVLGHCDGVACVNPGRQPARKLCDHRVLQGGGHGGTRRDVRRKSQRGAGLALEDAADVEAVGN